MNRLLDRRDEKIEDTVKEIRNINQRPAGLQQLKAQQPHLVVKANAFEGKKTLKVGRNSHQTGDRETSRLTGSMAPLYV